jgi:hypothetical protein
VAKPIIFGKYQFRTKKSAKEEIQRRINKYEVGDIVTSEDSLFFSGLFKLHDEYKEKVGLGIKHIQVERDFHKNRCLYIHRTDNTKIDISWVHCVKPASIKSTVSVAFRRAVMDSIIAFKYSCISQGCHCPVLDISLNFENSHAAYIDPSFDILLGDFLKQTGNTFDSIELENPKPEDNDQRGILKDQNLKVAWQNYHKINAKLELWSVEANLRK